MKPLPFISVRSPSTKELLNKALTALKLIHSLTDPYADGAPDATAHDKLALEVSTITKPFVSQ